jgi:ubiquinone/menaquinone biosynthesis C-methylase UbiE
MPTVDYRSDPSAFAEAEALYLEVRTAEGRVLPVESIRRLPMPPPGDPHTDEWRIRAATADRIVHHLKRRQPGLSILDLGCGPGWMTALLAREMGITAVGVDCNRSELERGAKAFSDVPDLALVFGDIFKPIVDEHSFDAVIVAAALQYFSDARILVRRLIKLLKPGGEILIADTPLYQRKDIPAAIERTHNYYTRLGFPKMTGFYHHHALEDLAEFHPETLYDPGDFESKILRNLFRRPLSPFPLLSISASQ